MIKVAVESPQQEDIAALLSQSDAVAAALYLGIYCGNPIRLVLLIEQRNYLAHIAHRDFVRIRLYATEVADKFAQPQNRQWVRALPK